MRGGVVWCDCCCCFPDTSNAPLLSPIAARSHLLLLLPLAHWSVCGAVCMCGMARLQYGTVTLSRSPHTISYSQTQPPMLLCRALHSLSVLRLRVVSASLSTSTSRSHQSETDLHTTVSDPTRDTHNTPASRRPNNHNSHITSTFIVAQFPTRPSHARPMPAHWYNRR